jgi:hypothetical protein
MHFTSYSPAEMNFIAYNMLTEDPMVFQMDCKVHSMLIYSTFLKACIFYGSLFTPIKHIRCVHMKMSITMNNYQAVHDLDVFLYVLPAQHQETT